MTRHTRHDIQPHGAVRTARVRSVRTSDYGRCTLDRLRIRRITHFRGTLSTDPSLSHAPDQQFRFASFVSRELFRAATPAGRGPHGGNRMEADPLQTLLPAVEDAMCRAATTKWATPFDPSPCVARTLRSSGRHPRLTLAAWRLPSVLGGLVSVCCAALASSHGLSPEPPLAAHSQGIAPTLAWVGVGVGVRVRASKSRSSRRGELPPRLPSLAGQE